MITGAVLGALIVMIFVALLFSKGQNVAYTKQIDILQKGRVNDQIAIQQAAAAIQEVQKPFVIKIDDTQAIKLAEIILFRMRQIVDAEAKETLNKLD